MVWSSFKAALDETYCNYEIKHRKRQRILNIEQTEINLKLINYIYDQLR